MVVNQTTNVSYTAWTGTDDTSGNFTSTWTAPSNAAGDTLQLTVTGEISGRYSGHDVHGRVDPHD